MDVLLQQFCDEKSVSLAPSSLQAYIRYIQEFGKIIQKPFSEITKADFTKYLRNLQERNLANRTVICRSIAVKEFIRFLWSEDKISSRDYKGIMGIKLKAEVNNDERTALSPEELKICLREITEPQSRFLFWVGLNYGLRCSEYSKLKMADVDLTNRILTVRLSKGQKTRKIKILPSHVENWKSWFNMRRAAGISHKQVFFGSSRRPKVTNRTIQRRFQKMRELLEEDGHQIQFTSHTLRYTYSTNLWRGGVDLFVISRMLGHSSIKTTEGYLKVEESEILSRYEKQAIDALKVGY